MSWFADLAGKAESLLNNLDEQTAAALRNQSTIKQKRFDKNEYLPQPETAWGQRKRPPQRNQKKITPITETKSYAPMRKPSPTHHQSRSPVRDSQEVKNGSAKPKKVLSRKSSPQYDLNHCPKTLVGDMKDNDVIEYFGMKNRKFSLPDDLENVVNSSEWMYKVQNLEIENAMLKNELNVMNREVSELLDRLRKTEDGNKVVSSSKELSKTHLKLENSELLNHKVNIDKESLNSQLEQLKSKIQNLTSGEMMKYKQQNQEFENEIVLLKDQNREFEDKLKDLEERIKDKDTAHLKVENELRHAQSIIKDLQNNLDKSKEECQRLEKDWEAYKLRVKSMLNSKDSEIKALHAGVNINEDTNVLREQMEALKEERDELSEAVLSVRRESCELKNYVEQLESRHNTMERVMSAIRDALKDERAARNKAEVHANSLAKELKTLQNETGQTIASLRTALRDKESELSNLRDTSSPNSTDTSALNVADYDVMQDSIDNEKIQYLTHTLVQKQGKIESLLADNNMLRIQLEKLESKYKTEVTSIRATLTHSVVHLQDGDYRLRSRVHAPESVLSTLSMRIGVVMRKYPIFRMCVVIYMIGLHLWVFTVLLTSTPEDYVSRPTRS